MKRRRNDNQKGFTLIELMAVIAILAMIVLIAVPAVGSILSKAKAESDEASIALMERAGELAFVGGLEFDAVPGRVPEEESYSIPTLITEGYLNLDDVSGFHSPDNYVKKINKSGTFVFNGAGSGGDDVVTLDCAEAEAQGYTCIYTPEEFDAIRDNVSGKYILMNDIDLSGYAHWEPIGTLVDPFMGELNGNGQRVIGLSFTEHHISSKNENHWGGRSEGLFGNVAYGTIHNLTMSGVSMTYDYYKNYADEGEHSGDSYYSNYRGLLIGSVESNQDNNPDGEPLVLEDINIAGTVDVVVRDSSGEWTDAGWDEYVGVLTGLVITDNSLVVRNINVDVSVDSSGSAAGLFGGYVEMNGGDQSLTIDQLSVNGVISASTPVGMSEYMDVYQESGTVSMTNIEINADLNPRGRGYAAGFITNYYMSRNSDHAVNTIMRNISVDSDMTMLGEATNLLGFAETIQIRGQGSSIIEDIRLTGTMDGVADKSSDELFMNHGTSSNKGVFSFVIDINYENSTGEHTLRNIDINHNIDALQVYSFVEGIETENITQVPIIEGVRISGEIAVNHRYFGLANRLYLNGNDVIVRNYTNTATVRDGDLMIPAFEVEAYAIARVYDGLTLENIQVSPNINISGTVHNYK